MKNGFQHHPSGTCVAGFSLVELLIVMGIAIILITMAARGVRSVTESSQLDLAGRILMEEISIARQTALASNKKVEVHLRSKPRYEGAASVFHTIQTGQLDEDGTFQPLRGEARFPSSIAMATNQDMSSVMRAADGNEVVIIIRPDSTLEPIKLASEDLSLNSEWYVTLMLESQLNQPLSSVNDFMTIQIDPVTARTTAYRP